MLRVSWREGVLGNVKGELERGCSGQCWGWFVERVYRAMLRVSCREGVAGNVEGELERGCISTINGELEIAATVWVQLCAWVWVCGWMCVCVCLCAWVCVCIFHSFINGGDTCLLSHHLWCQYSMHQPHTSRTYCYILPLQLISSLPFLIPLPPPPSPLAARSNMSPFQLGLAILAYCGQSSAGNWVSLPCHPHVSVYPPWCRVCGALQHIEATGKVGRCCEGLLGSSGCQLWWGWYVVCACVHFWCKCWCIYGMSQETLQNPMNSVEILSGFSADFVRLPCS